jgi:hypothetical protein
VLRVVATPSAACADAPTALEPGTATTTNDLGEFRILLRTFFSPGTRCVRLVVHESAIAGSDSLVLPPMVLDFVAHSQALDSLGLLLTMP